MAAALSPVIAPSSNCLDYLPADLDRRSTIDWRETLAVEHCDRIQRLWQLSRYNAYGQPPQFFDGYVARSQLPTDIGVDLPILRVVFPERVFFDTARAELRPEAVEVARILARNLQLEPPDVVLFVAGHTDARGSREYNQGLSVERANAVADAILSYGVNVARVWRVGFGEDMPLRAGDTEQAWGQNRRVEFLFAARAEAVAAWMSDAQLDIVCQGSTAAEVNDCVGRLDFPTSGYSAIDVTPPSVNVSPAQGGVRIDPVGTRQIIINPVNRR